MDKTTKTILIVIVSLLVLCICACVVVFATGLTTFNIFSRNVEHGVSETIQESNLKPVQVGGEIADYIVPAGFESAYTGHFGDVTIVGFKSQNEQTHIVLVQFPDGSNVNFTKTLELIEEASNDPNIKWFSTSMTILEQIPVTIRGHETTLTISEGESSDGDNYRVATANFKGRGGPALMIIASPVDEWNMEIVKEFIATIQ